MCCVHLIKSEQGKIPVIPVKKRKFGGLLRAQNSNLKFSPSAFIRGLYSPLYFEFSAFAAKIPCPLPFSRLTFISWFNFPVIVFVAPRKIPGACADLLDSPMKSGMFCLRQRGNSADSDPLLQ